MKTRFIALFCLLLGFTFACSDDDKDDISFVSDATLTAFKKDFPGATKVDWKKSRDYLVADFYLENGRRDMEAWYDNVGKLYLTEKDITKEELPSAVLSALQSSPYKDWKIDDIDEITREGYETIYVIEVEQGKEEVDLVYSADGVLLREIIENAGGQNAGDFIPAELPASIKAYLDKNHPNARMVDVDKERTKWEIEIIEDKVKKEIDFSLDGNTWLQTKWEIAVSEIPEIVRQGINNSPYKDWEIDDVDYIENPQGAFYKVEFEKSGQKDVEKLFRAEDGVMVE